MNSEKRVVFEKYVVEIVSIRTDAVVETIGMKNPMTKKKAESAEITILHNLNKDNYFVRSIPFEDAVMKDVDRYIAEAEKLISGDVNIAGYVLRYLTYDISKELAYKIVDKVYNRHK